MAFLTYFTLASVLGQTIVALLVSWLILECKLRPDNIELQEVTLLKLLYLYDPTACERVYIYNYTVVMSKYVSMTSIQWPVKNAVAMSLRSKIKIWVGLHVVWLMFCVGYMSQGHRPCGFYALLMPFTMIGISLLCLDILYTTLFVADIPRTGSERDILMYINTNNDSLEFVDQKELTSYAPTKHKFPPSADTSWISLVFAFVSCRGIILWVFNFWMIKDNYFEGLESYRKFVCSRFSVLTVVPIVLLI